MSAAATARRVRGLILDFGGVVIKTPFELLRSVETRLNIAAHTLDWHGPFAPERDELWRRMQGDEISEREYWGLRAAEAGRAIGEHWTMRDLVAQLEADEHEFVRPEALAFLERAEASGIPVVVLTNDLQAFHGSDWLANLAVAKRFAHVIDGSVTGVLKPDPRAYRFALDAIGLAPPEALFVDDQPRNADGAEQAGLSAELFDVTRPAEAFARVLQRIGS